MPNRIRLDRGGQMELSFSLSTLIHSPRSVLSRVTTSSVSILVVNSFNEVWTLCTVSWSVCDVADVSGAAGGIVSSNSSRISLNSRSVNS